MPTRPPPSPHRTERPGPAALPFLARLRERRTIVILLLVLGALERSAWNLARDSWSASGEAFLVALSVGQGHGWSGAYGLTRGATAHVLPVSPGIAGLVYAVLGYRPGAEVVLAAWSIGLALGSYLLLDRAFARLGAPSRTRLAALAFLCLAPTYIVLEAVDFRVWEGGLAALLSALMLDRVLAADGPDASPRAVRDAILVAPLLFFVNPLMGAPAFLMLALLWLGRAPWRIAARRIGLSVLLLAALIAPWAIRNQLVLGEPVLLRSNAGLELALGQYPGAPVHGDRNAAFRARLHEIHPLQNDAAYAALTRAGGEVAYSRALGERTLHWMAANPGESLALTLAHVGDTITPGVWMFRMWGDAGLAPVQAWLASLVGVLGLIGLAAGLWLGGRRWIFVALPILVPLALFAPFQPMMRYTYLFYAPLAFCAACGLALLSKRLRPQSGATA